MQQQKQQIDLSKFPVCAKRHGRGATEIHVYYHVLPHPRIWGSVVYVPTGESTRAIPFPKYQKGEKTESQKILEFILEKQDDAIEGFKQELRENFRRAVEKAQTSVDELEEATEPYIESESEPVSERELD